MAKAYFSRKEPLYLLRPEEVTDSNGFDAYPVEVDEATLDLVTRIRTAVFRMEDLFNNNPAPEEVAQAEADALMDLLS